jgi:hypothetical protein
MDFLPVKKWAKQDEKNGIGMRKEIPHKHPSIAILNLFNFSESNAAE